VDSFIANNVNCKKKKNSKPPSILTVHGLWQVQLNPTTERKIDQYAIFNVCKVIPMQLLVKLAMPQDLYFSIVTGFQSEVLHRII
jgi:hypothetical protein